MFAEEEQPDQGIEQPVEESFSYCEDDSGERYHDYDDEDADYDGGCYVGDYEGDYDYDYYESDNQENNEHKEDSWLGEEVDEVTSTTDTTIIIPSVADYRAIVANHGSIPLKELETKAKSIYIDLRDPKQEKRTTYQEMGYANAYFSDFDVTSGAPSGCYGVDDQDIVKMSTYYRIMGFPFDPSYFGFDPSYFGGGNAWKGDQAIIKPYPSSLTTLSPDLFDPNKLNMYYSAKYNGMPYLCFVKENGQCDMIARQYVDQIDFALSQYSDVLMILSGEVVTWMRNGTPSLYMGSCKDSLRPNKNVFVIFDVLTPDVMMSVPKKLHILRNMLWDGRCKRCGVLETHQQHNHYRGKSVPAARTTCLETECNCMYGLRISHPLFDQIVVKRCMPCKNFLLSTIENLDENRTIFENNSSMSSSAPLLPLFDGIIFDSSSSLPSSLPSASSPVINDNVDVKETTMISVDGEKNDCVSLNGQQQRPANNPRHCFRYKWGKFISLDLLIKKKKDHEENKNTKLPPHHSYPPCSAVTEYDYDCYLLDKHGELVEYTSRKVYVPRFFTKRDVIIECSYDFEKDAWIFQRERTDKKQPNSRSYEVYTMIHCVWYNSRGPLELQRLYNDYHERRQQQHEGATKVSGQDVDDLSFNMQDIVNMFWNSSSPLAISLINDLFVFTTEINCENDNNNEDLLVTHSCFDVLSISERMMRIVKPVDVDRCLSISYDMKHPLARMFAYHDRIKSFLYSFFSKNPNKEQQGKRRSVIIDISATGQKSKRHRCELQQNFDRVVMIENEKAKQPTDAENEKIRSEDDCLRVIQGDACDPSMGERIYANLSSSSTTVTSSSIDTDHIKASCCFALFSFHDLISVSQEHFMNFARNIVNNLSEDNSYFIAIMGTSELFNRFCDYHVQSPNESGGSPTETPKTIFRLQSCQNVGNHWTYGRPYRIYSLNEHEDEQGKKKFEEVEDSMQYFPHNINHGSSQINSVLRDYGFLLQRTIPLNNFHHFFPSDIDGKLFDTMSEIERNISSKYVCVIWHRINLSVPKSLTILPSATANNDQHVDERSVHCQGNQSHDLNSISVRYCLLSKGSTTSTDTMNEDKQQQQQQLPLDILIRIFNFMDISSHFQLANTCKCNLYFYLQGLPRSIYLHQEMIQSLAFLKQKQLSQRMNFFSFVLSSPFNSSPGFTMPLVNAYALNPLLSLPCIEGCFFCTCQLSQLNQNRHPKNDRNCFCINCLTKSVHYQNSEAPFKLRNNKKCDLISLDSMAYFHHRAWSVSKKSSFIKLLVLKSLFLNGHALVKSIGGNDERLLNHHQDDDSVDWLAKLFPQFFANEVWNSSSTLSLLQSIRQEVDEMFINPIIAYAYLLASTLYQNTDSIKGEMTAMSKLRDIMLRHASWHERWSALRVGINHKMYDSDTDEDY